MYQTLWNSINKQVKNSHAYAAFLAVSLMGWTTIGLLAGFLICMIGGMSFVTKITGSHCFPNISQRQDSCPVINRTAVFLSKSYIQNHH